jgi:hypothetical protein
MRLSVTADDLASYDRPVDPKQKAQIHELAPSRRSRMLSSARQPEEGGLRLRPPGSEGLQSGPTGLTVFKEAEASGFDVVP